MDKIHIVNWLITRKCNLSCDYCRLTKNYKNKPFEYPDMNHYIKNEMYIKTIIEGLRRLKLHNKDCFNIIYGGEPLLRPDLYKIINYCNDNDIHYTIISNNSKLVQPLMQDLFKKVNKIEGYTASIDPILFNKHATMTDVFKKSLLGFKKLQEYSNLIDDVVAEITVTNENLDYLYQLVKVLTDVGINSDITFVDIAKSKYYDFSNVEDPSVLVQKNEKVKDILGRIIEEKLNVHMRDTLLPMIYETLPSEMDCGIEKDFHNMTIDGDGSVRLCLRIRGVYTPKTFNIGNILDENGNLSTSLQYYIEYDKNKYCQYCQWSCPIMSKMISNEEEKSNNLIHSEIRNG